MNEVQEKIYSVSTLVVWTTETILHVFMESTELPPPPSIKLTVVSFVRSALFRHLFADPCNVPNHHHAL